MLPQLAQGDANKVFVIPSEFSEAFGGIAKAFAEPGARRPRRRRRHAQAGRAGRRTPWLT